MLYYGNIRFKLLTVIVSSFCVVLAEFIADIPLFFFFHYDPAETMSFQVILCVQSLNTTSYMIVTMGAAYLLEKKYRMLQNRYNYMLMLAFLTQIIITINFTFKHVKQDGNMDIGYAMIMIILIVISGYFIYFYLLDKYRQVKQQQSMKLLLLEYEHQLESYIHYDEKEIRYLRHDLMNFLTSLHQTKENDDEK